MKIFFLFVKSADDCIDPDRIVSFDEDLSFLLIDFKQKEIDEQNATIAKKIKEQNEYFKFKLFCKFLKFLNVINCENELLDADENEKNLILFLSDEEDLEFLHYIDEKIPLRVKSRKPTEICGSTFTSSSFFNFFSRNLENLLNILNSASFNLLEPLEQQKVIQTLKQLNMSSIDLIRNLFKQAINSFSIVKYKTNLTILKWKFELNLLYILTKENRLISQEITLNASNYFCPKTVKKNMLDQVKTDLSIESNRSNFDLWKQYGILKWLLNHEQFLLTSTNSSQTGATVSLKETKKIFDTLLNTSSSSIGTTTLDSINIYSLVVDYVSLELGIFYKQFDVTTTSLNAFEASAQLSTIYIQNGLFNFKDINNLKVRENNNNYKALKIRLTDMLANKCLNKNQEHQQNKSKSTFKIGKLIYY
jgi:hypothetical protein